MIVPWTAVIPTYGRVGIDLTLNCVRTIWKHHYPDTGQVIVSDDGSPPDVVEILKQALAPFPNTALVANPVNRGFAATCNAGLYMAVPDSVMVLVNNDVELTDPALLYLSDYIIENNVHVAGIRLLYPDYTVQHGGIRFIPTPDGPMPGYFDHVARSAPQYYPDANGVAARMVTGAFFGIHPRTPDIIGLLDERYGMAVEDVDYCLSIISAGGKVRYLGHLSAIHHEGKTRGSTQAQKAEHPEWTEREASGMALFFDKWQNYNLGVFSGTDYEQMFHMYQSQANRWTSPQGVP